MLKTISARISEKKLKEIEELSSYEKKSRSEFLREVIRTGIKYKLLEINNKR